MVPLGAVAGARRSSDHAIAPTWRPEIRLAMGPTIFGVFQLVLSTEASRASPG